MKIRTRLLLPLLPTLILGALLILALLLYSDLFNLHPKWLIGTGVLFTMVAIFVTLFFSATKLSMLLQRLNLAALDIAAGQYGKSIQIEGPKEVAELANTLNTMSQCLQENIEQLQENRKPHLSYRNEDDSFMLLQELMLQKNIESCRSDVVAIRSIHFFSTHPRGVLLEFPQKLKNTETFQLLFSEAKEPKVEGIYKLLSSKKESSQEFILEKNSFLLYRGPFTPIVWSLEKKCFLEAKNFGSNQISNHKVLEVETGDIFFLFNHGFFNFYQSHQKIEALFNKVLKVFAQDGLDTFISMLEKEISFSIRRKNPKEDLHLIAFQLLDLCRN